MPYYINKTDGTAIVVLDGTKDTTSTSLTLVGRLASNYGEVQNENFVRLLENFAYSTSPANPINGQLWYDTTEQVIKVYDTGTWTSVGGKIAGNLTVAGNVFLGGSSFEIQEVGGPVKLISSADNADFDIYTTINGERTNAFHIGGTDGLVTVTANATSELGVTTKVYVDSNIDALWANAAQTSETLSSINLSLYATKQTPVFTGVPQAPTPSTGNRTTQLATTEFVYAAIESTTPTIDLSPYAPKNSPTFTGVPTAPTPDVSSNDAQIATTSFVRSVIPETIPRGVITLWYGSVATIPAGWLLCNGLNDTPDLRDKFVIGARSDSAGIASTEITGTQSKTGGTKDATVIAHSHTINDPGHYHTLEDVVPNPNQDSTQMDSQRAGSIQKFIQTSKTTTGITVNPTGDSGTNLNLPPYYALCYIMKA